MITDILTARNYFLRDHTYWGFFTTFFVFLPFIGKGLIFLGKLSFCFFSRFRWCHNFFYSDSDSEDFDSEDSDSEDSDSEDSDSEDSDSEDSDSEDSDSEDSDSEDTEKHTALIHEYLPDLIWHFPLFTIIRYTKFL